MKISHTWLQSYFDTPIPKADMLADLFTFHSFEVESVEEVEAGEVGDTILDVKILPDRAHYCLSHKGIAEEVSVLTGQALKSDRIPTFAKQTVGAAPQVTNRVPHFCRRYMCRAVDLGQPISTTPAWIRTHLQAIGQRSISPIVDATNVTMFDIGQPLHVFDAEKIKGDLVVRAAVEGERMALLEGSDGLPRDIVLKATDFVIADGEGPLVVAGVKGGKRAEVTAETKRLLIESANFEPSAVRRTSNRLNLRNESSKRYENEITPELAAEGMNDLSALIVEMCPKAVFSPVMDVYPAPVARRTITIDPAYISDRLGVAVPEKTMEGILSRMDIEVVKLATGRWTLSVPTNRFDLAIAEDVVEEVGRVYGYDLVPGTVPDFGFAPGMKIPVQPIFYLAEKAKNKLVSDGFSEVNLYTLVQKGEFETAYPLARDKAFARANLVDGMFACIERNAANAELLGLDTVKVFEIGRAFSTANMTIRSDGSAESTKLVIGVSQVKKMKGVSSDQKLLAAIQTLATNLGIAIPSPKIISKGPASGAGSISVCEIDLPEIIKSYPIQTSALYSELGLVKASPNLYKKFSLFPFMVRDIAVFVPEAVSADMVWNEALAGVASAQAASLLVRHGLFDTFKKDGKTSYAFRMVFQAADRTLTDAEMTAVMDVVYKAVKEKGWEVR